MVRLVAITRSSRSPSAPQTRRCPQARRNAGTGRNSGRRRRSGSSSAPPLQQNQPVEVTPLVTTTDAGGLTGGLQHVLTGLSEDLASESARDHDDHEHVVLNGVDDPVVTCADP